MQDELHKAPLIYQPSFFWQRLNETHNFYLDNKGLNNFKRTVNTKYFQWGGLGILIHQLNPILKQFLKRDLESFTNSKLLDFNKKNFFEGLIYKIYLVSLYEYILQIDKLNILKRLDEPKIGNPLLVDYKGKLISQDLCNSVYEFYTITNNIKLPKQIKIAELGAGYGRVGYVFLKIFSAASYCVIDIPPALFIAQHYLSKVFPREKIFKFRHFDTFEEVKDEFTRSRIQFLMPHQIELLPKKYFDLFINISSLHEMSNSQIKNYLRQINRLCKGYFYTKQWRNSKTKDNNFINQNEYPILKNWQYVYGRNYHPIQKMFFDAIYKIK